MQCTVCTHPQRHAIDHALLAGNGTLSALSQNYGPSLSALWRHKKHLQEKMRQAEKRLEHHRRQDYLFKFNNFLEVATDTVKTAGADGNSRLVLQAVREGTRILNFMAKLDVKLDQDTAYRLLASPQWTTQSSLLPTDPQFIADTHQALADCLFFPCPEPPPIPADEDDDDDDDWDDNSPEAETEEAGALSRLLARLDLDPTSASPSVRQTPNPALEILPKNQREISAKLARKSPGTQDNTKQFHEDSLSEKNPAKNRPSWPPGASPVPAETSSLLQPTLEPAQSCLEPESDAPPVVKPSAPPLNSHPELPPTTENLKPETEIQPLKTWNPLKARNLKLNFQKSELASSAGPNCSPSKTAAPKETPSVGQPRCRDQFLVCEAESRIPPPVYESDWNVIFVNSERNRPY